MVMRPGDSTRNIPPFYLPPSFVSLKIRYFFLAVDRVNAIVIWGTAVPGRGFNWLWWTILPFIGALAYCAFVCGSALEALGLPFSSPLAGAPDGGFLRRGMCSDHHPRLPVRTGKFTALTVAAALSHLLVLNSCAPRCFFRLLGALIFVSVDRFKGVSSTRVLR